RIGSLVTVSAVGRGVATAGSLPYNVPLGNTPPEPSLSQTTAATARNGLAFPGGAAVTVVFQPLAGGLPHTMRGFADRSLAMRDGRAPVLPPRAQSTMAKWAIVGSWRRAAG